MFRFFFLFFSLAIILRLGALQLVEGGKYRAIAEEQHARYEELVPRRGSIYARDARDATWYPLATTEPRAFFYADPRKIQNPEETALTFAKIVEMDGLETYDLLKSIDSLRSAGRITEADMLSEQVLSYYRTKGYVILDDTQVPLESPKNTSCEQEPCDAVQVTQEPQGQTQEIPDDRPTITKDDALAMTNNPVARLVARLSKKDDPYEPVARNIPEEKLQRIEALELPGIYAVLEQARVYPEKSISGQLLGFVGKNEEGNPRGLYGLEGYFDDYLGGVPGSLYMQGDRAGSWTGNGKREFTPAINGGDLYLTIDRTLQLVACEKLAKAVEAYDADGGALIIIEPSTGKILTMCGAPDFSSAEYGLVTDAARYTNPVIFSPYEPGSIMKPLTMAAAIDVGAVTPESTYHDEGFIDVGWKRPIKNAADKVFGTVTMIEALEESVNTAMVWVMRQMGQDALREYFEKFGFGTLVGVPLNTEVSGTIASLDEDAEVYAATAAFGQGITVTPLQIAAAYAALANGGSYMQPYVIERKVYPDGTVEDINPTFLRQVVSKTTAQQLAGMLVAVVEYGHGKRAGVPGYYIAGKTGTAQIADHGVYSATAFNGSFAGFGPVENPRFAMVVKIENPKHGVIYAESTAAPVFGEVADFLLSYYGIAPTR